MGVSPRVVYWLRREGYDAVHVTELRMQKTPDDLVLLAASNDNRVILTHDRDFARLLAISGASRPSVVLFRLRDMRPDSVISRLGTVVAHHSDDLDIGAIVTVGETWSRSKRLPIVDW